MAQNWWEAAPVAPPGGLAPRGYIYTPPADPSKARAESREDARLRLSINADARAAAAAARQAQHDAAEQGGLTPPGDLTKTGDEYLATLPPGMAAQVRAIADGRRAIPSSTRNKEMMTLLAAASQFDPTLDAANAATRVATRKKFTSGTTRDNITAINTALGHLGSLWTSAQALHNRSLPAWNAVANALESATGDARVNTFNMNRHAVVDELEKAFRGSSGTQAGIEEWKQDINSSQSPDQLRAAIAKGVELLNSRLESLNQAYSDGMGKSSDPMEFLNPHAKAVFTALAPGGSGVLPDDKGGGNTPPALGGGPKGPSGPADYSGMVGKDATLATGDPQNMMADAVKKVPDNEAAAALAAFVRKGRPYDTVAAYARSHGFEPPNPDEYAKAVGYQKANPNSTPNVDAFRNVRMSLLEKAAASPLAAGVVGALNGATAGFNDLGGHLIGGDSYDANRAALRDTHSTADMIGNVIGGAGGALAAPAALARIPGAMGLATRAGERLGNFAPMAGDAAYGAVYGANESPDDPLIGGVAGLAAGVGGGMAGRGLTGGLANVIAPPAGKFAPAYANGAMPTIGQRFGAATGLSGLVGRGINVTEQALQSFPLLGALVAHSRELPRQVQKLGMVNDALGHIEAHQPGSLLPTDIRRMGTEAQAHAAQKFDQAYQTARAGMQFTPDQPYLQEAGQLAQRVNSAEFTPEQSARVAKAIDDSVVQRLKRNGGNLAGDQYVRAGSELGRIRNTWAANPETAHMADVLGDYMTTMDNAAIRSSDPAAGQMLKDTNAGFAKLVRIQKAGGRVGGEAGDFTPKAFTNVVQKEGGGVRNNAFNQGSALMQDDAQALSLMNDTLPTSGSAERLMTGQAVAGGAGAMMGAPGALVAHPGALAPFAMYLPGVDSLVKRAIAPNAQRLSFLPPDVAAALDRIGSKINNFSPYVGRASAPGALAYFGSGQ